MVVRMHQLDQNLWESFFSPVGSMLSVKLLSLCAMSRDESECQFIFALAFVTN